MRCLIYLRTSTKEQNPELQRKDCIEFCSKIGLEVAEVFIEQGSAYKLEKIRPIWESVVKRAKNEKLDIVLWRYDRAFRNRAEFFSFMKVMFEVFKTRVYSVTEPSIMSFWNMMESSHSDNPVFNELLNGIFRAMWDFMIQQAGEQAEEESRKKSERVKLAVRTDEGITKSYKGNKWGRKSMSSKADELIIKLSNEGKTMRDITKEVYYWDKAHHKKFVSLGYVHKIIDVHKSSIQNKQGESLAKEELNN
jgi:DNA invertase Pin-like site-specific DNA recombinase